MASPVTSAGEPTGNLSAVLAGETSAPESAPPTQAPEVQAQPEPPAPEQGQQAPPADSPSSPATTIESKDYQDWIARHGGDPSKAARAAFDANNRVAEMARVLKERGIDPVTLEPLQTDQAPPEQAPATPEPSAQVDPTQVDQYVRQSMANDQDAVRLTADYHRIDTRLTAINGDPEKGISGELAKVQHDLQVAELRLTIPEIAEDPFRKAEALDALRDLRSKLSEIKAESRELRADKQDTVSSYKQLADGYRDRVKGHLGQEAQKRQQAAELERAVSRHEQDFAQQWPNALDQAITTHNIPAELGDRFKREAKKAALAYSGPIHDIRGFVEAEAKSFLEGLDLYHRVKSAQFGAQAVARASTPGPTGSAAVAPHKPDSAPSSEAELTRGAFARFNDNLRAALGG